MLNVAIVDDESLVRVGFQTIIDWESEGYALQGAYRNGLEAWNAFCAEGFPDILLTDIRMPEMDGLELIRRIREKDEGMIILVLSSYEEFEYTRRSIQLGVQDYIPKHLFDPAELLATLGRLQEKRGAAAQAGPPDSSSRAEELKAEKRRLMTRSRSLPGIVEAPAPIPMAEYPRLAEQAGNAGAIQWIAVREVAGDQPYLESELSALGFLLHDLMDKTVNCVPLGIDQGVFVGLIFHPRSGDPANAASSANLAEEWAETVRRNLAIAIAAGLSAEGEIRESKVLRAQAARALDVVFFRGAGVFRYGTEMTDDRVRSRRALWQENVQALARRDDPAALTEWMNGTGADMGLWCVSDDALHMASWALKAYLQERTKKAMGWALESELDLSSVIGEFEAAGFASSWDELASRFRRAVAAAEERLRIGSLNKTWLGPVLSYIDEHFAEGLRLEDAASVANLNVNYFSHRFSQETGMTFLDYLTRVRIREAIRLLRTGQLSAEEAASRVGYPNANYFVKVFKKVTGMTLSEFRKSDSGNLKIWNGIE